jgi:hypothetical protein
MIVSSGGFFVHAFNALGVEPVGWPKNTGHWVVMSPSVGDVDDDGQLEVVIATRLGDIHVYDLPGPSCGNVPWRKARHDEWLSGVAGKDTLRPAKIDDASITTPTSGDVVFTFTAVGDDGRCGTATTYELRGSPLPITEANFASATPIAAPAPAAAGESESIGFTPPPGAIFYALRAVDEAGNAGPITASGPTLICGQAPAPICRAPVASRASTLLLVDRSPDGKDRLLWRWTKGAATAKADFGDPFMAHSYQLCIYDGATLITSATAPAGGNCNLANPRPCWKESATGFRYVDRDLTPDGVQQLVLKAGAGGKAQIVLKGKGDRLGMPTLPVQTLPITAQLRNSAGECWGATYSGTFRNDAQQVRARSD